MKLFAIFGNPVEHSRSPLMHNYLFNTLDIKACYTKVHLKDGSKLRDTFLKLRLSGANITIPFKEDAYKACDEIRGFANEIGVVNTIINENNRLIGYNTDADGFIQAIQEFKNIQNILIIGAGGTAKALTKRLLQNALHVSILNRSANRLDYFKKLTTNCYDWNNFICSKYDLVINTTSAGLTDNNLPAPQPIIENIMINTRYICDVVYGKKTPFLKLAKIYKLPYKDGSDMLLYQGVLANHLFCDKQISIETTAQIMKRSFELF